MSRVVKNLPRTYWRGRAAAVAHRISLWLGTRFPDSFPFIFVVGYPKSGTTWVSQLVADYFQLPYPRGPVTPLGFPAVIHGHELVRPGFRNCVFVLRDGRDVMVSRYFSMLRRLGSDRFNPRIPRRMRRNLPPIRDKEAVREHLPQVIEYQAKRPRSTRYNWAEHYRGYVEAGRDDVPMIRYEDLLADGPRVLAEAMAQLADEPPDYEIAEQSIERFSFRRQTGGRGQGTQDASSYLRKGQAGDWRNYFNRAAGEVFDEHFGDVLIEGGYERDRRWLDELPED